MRRLYVYVYVLCVWCVRVRAHVCVMQAKSLLVFCVCITENGLRGSLKLVDFAGPMSQQFCACADVCIWTMDFHVDAAPLAMM